MADVHELLDLWIERVTDEKLLSELHDMRDRGESEAITDAFFQDLAFGTAGLRGIIGPGTNRMNIYTVGRATQGFATYLRSLTEEPSVAIARDSRHGGELFVRTTAAILAANGVRVHIYPEISPVPTLSWAVRDLCCTGGICMTASHNPAAYNGYKVYGPDGCQITSQAARAISKAIERTDPFDDVTTMEFDEAVARGLIRWIDDEVLRSYYRAVIAQSVSNLTPDQAARTPLRLVYTPLNGTGLIPVTTVLSAAGITDVTVVPEQRDPDGDFPTCPYPNPEIREAMQKGIDLSERIHPDLLLATDPDADRVGVAVKSAGDYLLLTGNEIGVLLLDYICRMRSGRGEELSNKVAVTTIVSSAMTDALAAQYGFELRRVLTGFKYIGDIITELERDGEPERFIFGFEESYGYLSGDHVRDKDAVNASLLICQMAQYYKTQSMSLADAMERLYERHGYYHNKTISLAYPGAEGAAKMSDLMIDLRKNPPTEIGGSAVERVIDYASGVHGLPAADVVEFDLAGGNKAIVRPSGTEPKIKLYVFAKGADAAAADELMARIEDAGRELLS
ncbi:phosphoglucomutase/phosphomannomutase alpha/beta/alpha domain I [Coriobacterium glomerans PW2]|uniref:Phosphoglucomutase/phosphomannomutase alpha/beta/alpha domain I n=1 Tax=Coriobacterium glomerans (strain ATCC 49209 / DSM 20642 / JCM 10262 / PW2) TaxID=700015 RepID=F2N6X4_CORGP|nr:phospho-sugar mutase [Coriobacterium glomerans]AEB06173.1 phosphoglucomutase/phosphomannomutase alpha/beta/alpha domain I [Coriobacterium glomerans PW2]